MFLLKGNIEITVKLVNDNSVEFSLENGKSESIQYNELLTVYKQLLNEGSYSINEDVLVASLLASLPFAEISVEEGVIRLTSFHTEELPVSTVKDVTIFLEELATGTYKADRLSEQLAGNQNLFRRKSNARQNVRMLGILDKEHYEQNSFFERYRASSNQEERDELLKTQILSQRFFQMVLSVLVYSEDKNKGARKQLLFEIVRKIVWNSRGENQITQSVAEDRLSHTLNWLSYFHLIDENCLPIHDIENSQERLPLNTRLRETFISILNNYSSARKEKFSKDNEMYQLVNETAANELKKLPFIHDQFKIKTSVGQGNWTFTPWIAFLHKDITRSTQNGFYIVYLFHEDMSKLFLAFGQGVTNTDSQTMANVKQEIRQNIEMDARINKNDLLNMGAGKTAKGYAESTAAYIEYDREQMPSEETLIQDLEMMIGYYESYIQFLNKKDAYELPQSGAEMVQESMVEWEPIRVVDHIHTYISGKGFYYEKEEVTNLYLSLKTKPFVILSGISGTGKTMVVRWFAESLGATEENGQFTVIPVRPDWNDGTDLIGFEDLKGEFQKGPLTDVLLRAIEDPTRPYFVLLDEMNLARVEYYFSDLLSVMESKKWQDGKQVSSRVLPFQVESQDVYLPANVYLIGTVNMDETTFPFSKKVLDRANTIEFNRVRLDHLSFLTDLEEQAPIALHNKRLEAEFLTLKDVYALNPSLINEVTELLVRVNEALKLNGSHIGYRIRDEICFYLVYNERDRLLSQNDAFDLCLLQKILPRLTGSDARMRDVLLALFDVLTGKRIQQYADIVAEEIELANYRKSTEKVAEMLRGLEQDGFTSFWISS